MNRLFLVGAGGIVLHKGLTAHASAHNIPESPNNPNPIKEMVVIMFNLTGYLFMATGRGCHHIADMIDRKNKD